MNRLNELHQAGTSPWLDYIRRDILEDGTLARRIQDGKVLGITSNPKIYARAFDSSALYNETIKAFLQEHPDAGIADVFEHEVIIDMRTAADLLLPVYEKTEKVDGYVSLEISPRLTEESGATLAEARRLFRLIDRPNAMVKIPATPEGLPAIRQAIREGININATLVFSLSHYEAVAEAFIAGLEDRVADGNPVDGIASLASFFISRIDGALDPLLPAHSPLKLKAAVSNSRLAYERFQQLFFGSRFNALKEAGAQVQRPLWASTRMRDPNGRDVFYVESLIGPYTVSTMPPKTMEAFEDHGEVRLTIADDLETADDLIAHLARLGIKYDELSEKLQLNGLQSLSDAYEDLLQTVAKKRDQILA